MTTTDTCDARRPGRKPRGPFRDKRRTLTTRITEETRGRLEGAASANDRSLSQEIELRLERSFLEQDIMQAVTELRAEVADLNRCRDTSWEILETCTG